MNINITKPYLPPIEEYFERVKNIFNRGILTNQGPEVKELECNLKKILRVNTLHYVTNGTIALQLALEALGIKHGEVITTPFSYVATCSSILWQRLTPVFADIECEHFTIAPKEIEKKISSNTVAIMPVHVFGYACKIEQIEQIAKTNNLKVIYDAAHSFGSIYKGRSLCSYGDISTLSFHATKLFHTIEGGACVVNSEDISEKIDLIKRFGHNGDNHHILGINGKQDEFNAAMGNVILPKIKYLINERKKISNLYDFLLDGLLERPSIQDNLEYNYAYYPVIFPTEESLLHVKSSLEHHGINIRRYFYPSLNKLPYIKNANECKISQSISSRIACLPLFNGLKEDQVIHIVSLLKESFNEFI